MSVLSFRCQHRYPDGFRLEVGFDVDHPFTALFGPSGSGKTSVLNMIAGFLRPKRGSIDLGNRVVLDTERQVCLPPERRHVGMVFQDALLFPHLTVEANLRYGQRRQAARGRLHGPCRHANAAASADHGYVVPGRQRGRAAVRAILAQ